MQGYPVLAHNRIPIQSWDRAPWNRWTFQHVREILPTTSVCGQPLTPWKLPQRPVDISSVPFQGQNEHKTHSLTVNQWLETSYTDGFIVLHRGDVVFERYMNDMTTQSPHLSQSMSKSITASVASILIQRGLLDVEKQITDYLPELEDTAWKGATLQHVLDMTTGVKYVEDYEALDSDIATTDIACGWKPAPAQYVGPSCIWDQILSLAHTTRPHGQLFEYRSIETDVLAHCMERVTQTRLATLVSTELWQPLGCEHPANFTVDSAGYALACGGFSASLRDFARFGLMYLQRGFGNGKQILPIAWIDELQSAEASLFNDPYTRGTPKGAYHNHFWVEDVDRSAYMARGVFGQFIYVDPDNDLVCVKLSTWPEFTSVPRLHTTLNAFHAIGQYLNC
ncbi:MAG: serine hydrolase [Gammaproteobacteria bacterium]|nr:serine hydrolase [Gammaproteobacteria bacterium]